MYISLLAIIGIKTQLTKQFQNEEEAQRGCCNKKASTNGGKQEEQAGPNGGKKEEQAQRGRCINKWKLKNTHSSLQWL